jgi:hypothetical protein
VTAQDITVKGSPIPSVYMDQIRQTDFARDAMNNPDNKAALERYEEIKIENGKLIVIPKKPESDPGQPPTLNRSEAETNK